MKCVSDLLTPQKYKIINHSKFLLPLLIIILMQASSPAQSSTWHHLGGPMGGCIGEMAIDSKGELFTGAYWNSYTNEFTVQPYEGFYSTTDAGKNWKKFNTPIFPFPVYALYITKKDVIYAGLDGAKIFRSTNSGNSWSDRSSGFHRYACWALGANKDETVLFASDAQEQRIYRSTNEGINWTVCKNIPGLSFAVDSNKVIYCGAGTGMYKSTDEGITWIASGLTNIPISSVIVDSNNNVYCGTGFYELGQGVFYSTDTGNTWTNIGLNDKVIYSVTFSNHGSLLAGSALDGLFETYDNGVTWLNYSDGLYKKEVFRVKVDKDDNIIIGSSFEGIFVSRNGGNNFDHVGLPTAFVKNMEFYTDSLILTSTVAGVQKYNRFTKEWTNIGLQFVNCVSINNNGIIVAGTTDAGLYKSTDMGKTWENIFQEKPIYNVKIKDSVIFLSGYWGMYRSTNLGGTWLQLPTVNHKDNSAIFITQNNDVWLTGDDRKLYKTTDFGITFDSVTVDFAFPSINNIYIDQDLILIGDLLNTRGLFYSSDYGLNWSQNTAIRSTTGITGNNEYIFASRDLDIIFSRKEYFKWDSTAIPQPFFGGLIEIECDNTGKLFVGTICQGLYEVDIVVGVEDEPLVVKNHILFPLYPNPFNSQLNVRYKIPSQSEVVIKVYNMIGEEIKKLEFSRSAGQHTENISFPNLVSGVYLIKFENNGFSEIRKVVYLK